MRREEWKVRMSLFSSSLHLPGCGRSPGGLGTVRPPGALLADAGAGSPFRGRLLFCDVFEDVICSLVCMLVLRGPPGVPATPTSRVPVFSYFPASLCLFTGLEPI